MHIFIDLGERSYPVHIESGVLADARSFLSPHIAGHQVCIVSNEQVASLYLDPIQKSLEHDFQVSVVLLPEGEQHKNLDSVNLIFDSLLENNCTRDVTLIALGGGVIGDMTGFAAASFMRGVSFIQIPTTLLAQVDSSVGGKTGVNHPSGKNMIGAFHQPQCVLIDVDVLHSLPEREFSAGLAEVIKYGFISDAPFITWLEANISNLLLQEPKTLVEAIARSCRNKAAVVSADEHEKGLRAILNLGHTFGHALEAFYDYRHYLHGEAVAIGMHMALELSCLIGLIAEQDKERGKQLILNAKLPIYVEEAIEPKLLLKFMAVDKKAKAGKVHLVLLRNLGDAFLESSVDEALIQRSMLNCMNS